MQSLVICSCAADVDAASRTRRFLEANCPALTLQKDAVASSADELLDTVESALSADLVLLLLSPDAIPAKWLRQEWESVLLQQPREFGTVLAYLLLSPCRFPDVLRRQRFFDGSQNWYEGMRGVKRWLMNQDPLKQERIDFLPPRRTCAAISAETLEDLQQQLADKPGIASGIATETALEFAHSHWLDFASVVWIDCANRSYAGVLGETAQALGLRLEGPAEKNRLALHSFASATRCLYVYDRLHERHHESLCFSGSASVIFTAESYEEPEATLSLDRLAELFTHWRHDPATCLQHLGAAAVYLEQLEYEISAQTLQTIKQLGHSLFGLLHQYGRLAEANEVVEALSTQAWREGDPSALDRWEREKIWIQESWGNRLSPRIRLGVTQEPAQLGFGF